MIKISDIVRYDGLSFTDYQQLRGYSFSWLKRARSGIVEPIKRTPKVLLGTMVDSLLTGVGDVDISDPLYPTAKHIAHVLRTRFGGILPYLISQVSYTAVFEHRGFYLEVKGRPDFLFTSRFIIDLKVSSASNTENVIEFMRYEDQQFGYAKMAEVNASYLLCYRNVKKIPEIDRPYIKHLPIGDSNLWWENKILEYGSVNKPVSI